MENGYRKLVRVSIDDMFQFSLYEREIQRYQLKAGAEISEECFHDIEENVVFRRGKQKALNLLKRMDYTEGELREKLKKSDFRPDMIDRVIAYIDSYHYLDDSRYTENYIRYKKSSKSIRQIRMELRQKGIDSELIEEQLSEANVSDEEAIKKAIQKKTKDVSALSYEEKQKIASYLFRKGFREGDIRRQLLL